MTTKPVSLAEFSRTSSICFLVPVLSGLLCLGTVMYLIEGTGELLSLEPVAAIALASVVSLWVAALVLRLLAGEQATKPICLASALGGVAIGAVIAAAALVISGAGVPLSAPDAIQTELERVYRLSKPLVDGPGPIIVALAVGFLFDRWCQTK